MKNNKKEKYNIWVYAVVLFMSAFIVLLFTAISQIKFNKNIMNYENILSMSQKEKNNYLNNLRTAEENIKLLQKDIEVLKKELEQSKKAIDIIKKEKESEIKDLEGIIQNYENLTLAKQYIDSGNIKESAKILKNEINKEMLRENAKKEYEQLLIKIFPKAAYKYYIDGYNYYKKGEYTKAAYELENSLIYSKNEKFTEDCMYILIMALDRIGQHEKKLMYANEYISISKNKKLIQKVKNMIK